VRNDLSPRARLHIGPIQESHVLANGMNYGFAQFVRCAETAQNGIGHFGAYCGVPIKADAQFALFLHFAIGRRLSDIMEESGPREGRVGFAQLIECERRVDKDIAFGMVFRGLGNTHHRLDFGQDFAKQTAAVQEAKSRSWRGRFRPDASEFLKNAFGADALNLWRRSAHGGECLGINLKLQGGGEADGTKQSEVVFFEAG